ncbi:MAG: ABC-2 family transporter protein [Acidimicrobiales bacterium]
MSAQALRLSFTTAMRADVGFSSLFVASSLYLFVTTAVSTLWSVAAGDGSIAGYTSTMFVWYLATSEICTIAIPQRVLHVVGETIGTGEIAAEMLRPVPVLPFRLAREFGKVIPKFAALACLGLIYATVVTRTIPSALGLLLAFPSVLLALALHVTTIHCFAVAAFWFRDAGTTWFLFQKLLFVLGGLLIPLQVLPDWFERVAWLTPFPLMAYAPARLAAGFVEPWLIALQLAWIIGMYGATRLAFRAGERKYMRSDG